MAVGGIMKFDPVKLDLDGKLVNVYQLDEKFRDKEKKIREEIENK